LNIDLVNFINSKYKFLEISPDQLLSVRCIHHVTFPNGRRYNYCEWNHVHEATRNLLSDYKYYVNTASWSKYCEKGTLAIDIGAHTGDTTIIMADLVGDNGLVLAFEPNPRVFPILDLNVRINTSANILPYKLAVTKEHNIEVEYIDHGNLMCNGGLVSDQWVSSKNLRDRIMDNPNAEIIKVNGINLAQFLIDVNLSLLNLEVGFIKIDCEGYDKEIIRASADFIKEKNLSFSVNGLHGLLKKKPEIYSM